MSRRRTNVGRPSLVGADPLVLRVRRLRRRAEYRKAAIAQRELVFREPTAGRWVLLGDLLARAGRAEQARDAFKQGQWLHRRNGHARKAEIVADLIARDLSDAA
jgi:Flp pilus assembly protein TadD